MCVRGRRSAEVLEESVRWGKLVQHLETSSAGFPIEFLGSQQGLLQMVIGIGIALLNFKRSINQPGVVTSTYLIM